MSVETTRLTKLEYYILLVHVRQPRQSSQCHKRWRVISCRQLNWLLPQPRLTVVMFSLCLSVCLSVCWQN